jgi:cob(I)alamin adenosyltransferase
LCQLYVFSDQAKRLRQTVEAAKEQSGDMKESIKQATRAAAAMEEFAKSATRGAEAAIVSSRAATETVTTVKDSMAKQLRAYLCVNFHSAGFQNPETNFYSRSD